MAVGLGSIRPINASTVKAAQRRAQRGESRESCAAGRDSPVGNHAERRRGLVPSLDSLDGEHGPEAGR
jgi:hypothetical protein